MSTPQLTQQQITQVSALVAEYILTQRQLFLKSAVPLTADQRRAMDGFFAPDLLDRVRVTVLERVRVQNPPFYAMLRGMGFANLPDFSTMGAITFSDVVVSHEPFTHGLLFHELVHVEQYRQLGVSRFSERYVLGFLTGGGYDGIPLEVNAYSLGARFEASPGQRFSVQDEVASWLGDGRL